MWFLPVNMKIWKNRVKDVKTNDYSSIPANDFANQANGCDQEISEFFKVNTVLHLQ